MSSIIAESALLRALAGCKCYSMLQRRLPLGAHKPRAAKRWRYSSTAASETAEVAERPVANDNHVPSQGRRPTIEAMRRKLSAIPMMHERRIYILGVGGLGKLIACSLAEIPNPPPITLLFHRIETLAAWHKSDKSIELIKNRVSDIRTGFEVETSNYTIEPGKANRSVIQNLIVCTKANFTATALAGIKHRLSPESTIVLLQNGMGMVEELNEKLFPDLHERPYYMQGVVTHGVWNKSKFRAEHTGNGTIALAVATKQPFEDEHVLTSPVTLLPLSSRYLLRTLTRAPTLAAFGVPPAELEQLQLEKVAVNGVVNPITAIFGCRNGDLLPHTAMSRVMRLLLAEISLVIRSLPELQGVPNISGRFSSVRLEILTVAILQATARNYSSMLQDVRRGNPTEVDHINGYIVRRGEEIGIRCVVNYAIMQMIHAKTSLDSQGVHPATPLPDALPEARELE